MENYDFRRRRFPRSFLRKCPCKSPEKPITRDPDEVSAVYGENGKKHCKTRSVSGRLLLAHKLYPAVLLGRGMAVSAALSTVTVLTSPFPRETIESNKPP